MKKRIFICVAIVVLILSIWRMTPYSLRDCVDIGDEPFNTIWLHANETTIIDNSLNLERYTLDITSPEDKHYAAILSILESARFRSDFRNLIPWNVEVSFEDTVKIVLINLKWGDSNEEQGYITLADNNVVIVEKYEERLVYHLTDATILNQIIDYLKENNV